MNLRQIYGTLTETIKKQSHITIQKNSKTKEGGIQRHSNTHFLINLRT